jgi:flavin reductase (DIM6/NTAB) family NADH-FMN oxidoreductase RutF/acyl carrier protein
VELDPAGIHEDDIYRFMVSSILPRPIAWVSTVDAAGVANVAPFSYFMGVCCKPMTLLFCPVYGDKKRPKKDTLLNIEQVPEFVINVAEARTIEAVNLSAAPYAADESEFDHVGMTPVPSSVVRPPRVRESSVAFECCLREIVEINDGPGGGWVVLGTVVRVHARDEIIDPETLKVDLAGLDPVGRLGGAHFVRSTETFALTRYKWIPDENKPPVQPGGPAGEATGAGVGPEDAERRLLEWVRANAIDASPEEIDRDTPLLGVDSVLDSLAFASLLLVTEELLGRPLESEDEAELERFETVATILTSYFAGADHSHADGSQRH